MDDTPHTPVGHERTDAHVRPLVLFLALLALGCGIALLLMRWTFDAFERSAAKRDEPGHPLASDHQQAPAPRLQADPPAENAAFEARQRELLTTYGWLDPDGGVVRLPVERALELVLEEGLPAREEGEPGR
jgi:hypothetical protein